MDINDNSVETLNVKTISKKDGITIYHLDKLISDEKMQGLLDTPVKPSNIKYIITHDADVYDKQGNLLALFRKKKLPENHIKNFFDGVIDFAMTPTSNRKISSGAYAKGLAKKVNIYTNIVGYFDKMSPRQKFLLKQKGIPLGLQVRETRFNQEQPEVFKTNLLPLIQDIDKSYKKYVPNKYKLQRKKADQTPFRIEDTSFTTVTVNINFKTTIHKDAGDDPEGFGNLVVIEDGEYEGGQTCFPQFGIGVDVRQGDVLFMNVHEFHGNLPIVPISKDARRMAIVSYLRHDIWKKTKGMSRKKMTEHINKLRKGLGFVEKHKMKNSTKKHNNHLTNKTKKHRK
jgi:hypothetical protein